MTKALPGSVRDQLNKSDPVVDAASPEAKERLREQAEAILDAYALPEIRVAQFLMEMASGLATILARYPDDRGPVRAELSNYKNGLVALASVVSRPARGRPPL